MAINFPNNPSVNDTFTVGGINFTFTGVKWESGAVVELSSDTTPILGGHLDGGAKNINNVGVITATGFSGPLTGNVTGNATGLTGDPSIQVTNATVLGNLDVQGTTSTIDTAITQVDSLAVEGSVGIGTTNPSETLHLFSNNQSFLKVQTTGTYSPSVLQLKSPSNGRVDFTPGDDSNASGRIIYTHNDDTMSFSTKQPGGNRTERLRIISDGKVGINSTIPTSQLDVNGNITSSGTIKTGSIDVLNAGGAGSTLTGDGRLTLQFPSGGGGGVGMFSVYSGTSKNIEFFSGGSATFAGTISDSIGSLRDIPLNDQSSNASYTLIVSDAGKVVHASGTTSTVVVPNGVFGSGNVVTILNGNASSNITISQGSGFALRNTADGSSGNRTLAAFGMATIYFTGSSVGYISGSNMT